MICYSRNQKPGTQAKAWAGHKLVGAYSVVLFNSQDGHLSAISINQQVTIFDHLNWYADTVTIELTLALQTAIGGRQHVQVAFKVANHEIITGNSRPGQLAPGKAILNPKLSPVAATERYDIAIGGRQKDIAVTNRGRVEA